MKLTKFTLSAIVCLFAVSAFAQTEPFTPNSRFLYTGAANNTDRQDPTKYVFSATQPTLDRSSKDEIGYIGVLASQIYTQADIDADPNDVIVQAWKDKPKVNPVSSGSTGLPAQILSCAPTGGAGTATDYVAGSTYFIFACKP